MEDRNIVKGATYQWTVYWKDSDGVAIDFTAGSRVGYYRLKRVGSTSVAATISTGTASEFSWTSQSEGIGVVTILSNKLSSLETGKYFVDSYWEDTNDTPTTRYYTAETAVWEIVSPGAGDFS